MGIVTMHAYTAEPFGPTASPVHNSIANYLLVYSALLVGFNLLVTKRFTPQQSESGWMLLCALYLYIARDSAGRETNLSLSS
jgi:hypothetical protein